MDVKTKIITQFVRDLSFENPNGPGSFQTGSDRPTINANVDVKAQNRKDTNIYEVELNVSVNASRADQSLYIVDLKYVGICLLYTSPSPRDAESSRMPSSA